MLRRFVIATVLVAAALLVPVATAAARTTNDYAYPRDKVWNTSLRLVRIDLGCPLGDRDADVGYFTFEYVDGARRYPGSVEFVPTRVEGRDGVRVVVQIPAMPSYVERMILDKLQRKLVEDFGEPAPAPPSERPADRRPAERNPQPSDREPPTETPAEPPADAPNRARPAPVAPRERA